MALPRPRHWFSSLLVTPSAVSVVRANARLMPDDVIGLVRHLRKDAGG